MNRLRKAGTLASLITVAAVGYPQVAQAATTISTAEISGSTVRIAGSGATPNARILVNGGWLSGTADASGQFTIHSSTFTVPSNCKVRVSDGNTSAVATLSGCSLARISARR